MKTINEKLKSAAAFDRSSSEDVRYTKRKNDFTGREAAIVYIESVYYFVSYIRYRNQFSDKIILKGKCRYNTLEEAEKRILKWS